MHDKLRHLVSPGTSGDLGNRFGHGAFFPVLGCTTSVSLDLNNDSKLLDRITNESLFWSSSRTF
jgi:hypothetical protein